MLGIPPELDQRLHAAFSRCSAFENDTTLRALFADARLFLWRDFAPENSHNRATRVSSLINSLLDFVNEFGQPALLLFIYVLLDHTAANDALYNELSSLAEELEKSLQLSLLPYPDHRRLFTQVPRLLPYLVNRESQNFVLSDTLEQWRQAPSRIFIYFVYGDELQCHYKFMETLVEYSLPQCLGLELETPIQVYRMEWPQIQQLDKLPKRLQQNLAKALSKNRQLSATIEQINTQFQQHLGPICIEMHVWTSEWNGQTIAKLQGLLEFWEHWPFPYFTTYPLLLFVCVKYERIRSHKFFVPRQVKQNTQVINALKAIDFNKFERLACTILPQLEDIKRIEAEKWARLEENQMFCDCQVLLVEIRKLYNELRAMPMEELAQRLYSLLSRHDFNKGAM